MRGSPQSVFTMERSRWRISPSTPARRPAEFPVAALSFTVAGGRIEGIGIGACGERRQPDRGEASHCQGAMPPQSQRWPARRREADRRQARRTHHGVEATGTVLTDAVKRSRGHRPVLAMNERPGPPVTSSRRHRPICGQFFPGRRGLGCGVMPARPWVDLRDGIATIAQLRMRTPDTTLVGSGAADLCGGALDMYQSRRQRRLPKILPLDLLPRSHRRRFQVAQRSPRLRIIRHGTA